MMKKAFCVHGHFYQPPRENPFTGEIPQENGAAPYRNWNERIFDQCYRPNIELGNFKRISFDIGPTLAEWLAKEYPEDLEDLIAQENAVFETYGVSNGMAQSYNHTILPLATYEDKVTQIHWGILDFEHHFGHKPLGLWMPETAVDLETLSVMADEGIEFTIMAPWQARKKDGPDCSVPYWVDLPNGKRIAAFFYDAALSSRVSFDPDSTVNADDFLRNKILPTLPEKARNGHLSIIASDGELYGHHQPFRDRFLEWLTTGALEGQPIECTFPALWLKRFPPTKTIKIREKTSWSCHHGVKRWATVCDCAEHGEWKSHMRHIFNRIAGVVDTEMQAALDPYKMDLLAFRNEYIHVLTGEETEKEQVERLLGKISPEETETMIKWMHAQYERQRMFTSCGWFFGDFERIEARNNIAYAAMALSLVEELTGNTYYRKQIYRALTQVKSATTGVRASTIFQNILELAGRE